MEDQIQGINYKIPFWLFALVAFMPFLSMGIADIIIILNKFWKNRYGYRH
jgi:hypothetical protein